LNQNIIIQYRKSKVKTGKPIAVKVGRTEIFTSKILLNNVSGNVIFNPIHKNKHGTTTPMILKIEDAIDVEPYTETDVIIPDIIYEAKKEAKRIKERIRYQKNNPIIKKTRKSIW